MTAGDSLKISPFKHFQVWGHQQKNTINGECVVLMCVGKGDGGGVGGCYHLWIFGRMNRIQIQILYLELDLKLETHCNYNNSKILNTYTTV